MYLKLCLIYLYRLTLVKTENLDLSQLPMQCKANYTMKIICMECHFKTLNINFLVISSSPPDLPADHVTPPPFRNLQY